MCGIVHRGILASMQAQDILHFWFTELTPKQHFPKDAACPKRNAILGRTSTPEELAYLSEPGSSF